MRIIAGDAKGRKLNTPNGTETRPTSDKVKGSIFNILGSSIIDAKVLDLFAGTGNLGLEALSRGAQSSVFIDKSREAINIIKENVRLLKYDDLCYIYSNDAFSAIDILDKKGQQFDIIFIDPPYHKDIIPEILNKIMDSGILLKDGIIIAEHDNKDEIPHRIKHLALIKSSTYGDTTVSFYKNMEE
ncbi:ribosomal RNA small subunit methyltransferase D [Oxobacter pfennigii]|uniref:Ribosomal RNA small subunit methyltransferase D n=1 Tax=Oxobacter pfennigii TaxID=36849 RepID=A0A0P8WZN5_9CLOT|nr:16S rRNA (guanine(966)-N(2))-methyltransferase RsmD [Oxobacter pfennigii]KPU43963.1 ribosomal RNA small subunit methyltransferase D [Oxobacter pfennigii]